MENSNKENLAHFYFYKTLIEFLNDISCVYSNVELKESINEFRKKYNIPEDINENKITEFDSGLIKNYCETFEHFREPLMKNDPSVFKESKVVFFDKINLSEIFGFPESTQSIQKAIFKYLQTMYLFSKDTAELFNQEQLKRLFDNMEKTNDKKLDTGMLTDSHKDKAKSEIKNLMGLKAETKEQKAMSNIIDQVTDEITDALKGANGISMNDLMASLMNPGGSGSGSGNSTKGAFDFHKIAESISNKMETQLKDVDEKSFEKESEKMIENLQSGLMNMISDTPALQEQMNKLSGIFGGGTGSGQNMQSIMEGMQKSAKLMSQMEKLDKTPVKSKKNKPQKKKRKKK